MSEPFLAAAQRRLWRLIAWPEGVRDALRQEPEAIAPLESLVTSDERLCAEDRLDVYANAYFYRIHDVLAEDFPTLAHLLGEDAFHDLVTSYLAVHPSRHPSLRFIGARLSAFLREHDAAESFRERFPWASDLAAFEATTEDVFDAADSPSASRAELAAVPPEAWNDLLIALRPSVRLLRLEWSVHDARQALRNDEPVRPPTPTRVQLCLWRRDEQVVHRELAEDEARALSRAAAGIHLGALCEAIADESGEEQAPARAAAWLAAWTADELVLALATM